MISTIKMLCFLVLTGFLLAAPAMAGGSPRELLVNDIGSHDGILIKDTESGKILLEKNSDKPLVPASTLKIVTSLAALHYLGADYRFVTECYRRKDGALILKGYGDPAFVSEGIDAMAGAVACKIQETPCIVVDDSYFASPLDIPGRMKPSLEPYDAPNSALSANFNTVAFSRKKGHYVSAEAQTPLLPFALDRVKSSGIAQGRIMIIRNQHEAAVYAGELFAYFLGVHGCRTGGPVIEGRADPETDLQVYRYLSEKTLSEIVTQLLLYSNNFTANQLLLCCGARQYGPPATLAKGLKAVDAFLNQCLDISDIKMVEGSGLSKDNHISAKTMSRVLDAFSSYQSLMRFHDGEYYKTGNLTDVSTRAGYMTTDSGRRYQYVIMFNSPEKDAGQLIPLVKQLIQQADHPIPH